MEKVKNSLYIWILGNTEWKTTFLFDSGKK